MTTDNTPPEIKTTNELRQFLTETEANMVAWANKKAEATGYVSAVVQELHTHQIAYHFWAMGRMLDIIDTQAKRIDELEKDRQIEFSR